MSIQRLLHSAVSIPKNKHIAKPKYMRLATRRVVFGVQRNPQNKLWSISYTIHATAGIYYYSFGCLPNENDEMERGRECER